MSSSAPGDELFVPGPLSARNRSSFAYPTLKDRVPVIICKIIDTLYRNRNKRIPEHQQQLKDCIEGMVRPNRISLKG